MYVSEEEKPRKGLNAELQQELHEKIISGEIDIGPMPDHSEPVKDIRPVVDGETERLFRQSYQLANRESRNGTSPE